jgi:AraC family transcriptional regulator
MSSAGRGWSGISAELRAHDISEMPAIVPQHLELTIAIRGCEDGLVRRSGAGQRQQTRPTDGTIWMSPIGVVDNEISVTAPLPQMLHLFVPTERFCVLAEDHNLPRTPAHSIRYLAGVQDKLIRQIGLTILAELDAETTAGRMLVETLSLTVAARLAHSYSDSGFVRPRAARRHQLDSTRLRRVLDYVAQHLHEEITVADLAGVACLSTFHFTRMFAAAVEVPPHRYVSQRRLEAAIALLAAGKLPLSEIALKSRFATQAGFNRAFRRATGMTPGAYRRLRR